MAKSKMNRSIHKIKNISVAIPGEIDKHGVVCGVQLVLFNDVHLPETERGQNIWAFDLEGRFLWKIQPKPILTSILEPWMDFCETAEGKILVTSSNDLTFFVEKETGDILRMDGVKMPRVQTLAEVAELEKQGKWPPKK